MDFAYDNDQQAIIDLAAQVLGEHASHERQREIETGEGPRFDPALWEQLARTGLLGVAVPEAHGGAGLGFLEVAAVCEQMGAHTAPVPYAETLVGGALPIAHFGSASQQEQWLPKVAEGQAILCAALLEDQADPRQPTTRARALGSGAFALEGEKIPVAAAELASCILVPATVGEGGEARTGVWLVDPGAEGVTLEPLATASGRPASRVRLDGARVGPDAMLGSLEAGRTILEWMEQRALAAQCAMGLGCFERALERTAGFIKERKQFDQPIAMFQAVGHRAADAFIDVQCIRMTTLQACWRIDAGLPAEAEVALAKYYVADAGARVVAAAQHLHGGIGVDRDYPVHRFYLHAKELELDLGGASAQLRRIGDILAGMPLD